MFPLSPTMWGAVAVAVLVAALGAGLKVQTSRLDAVKAEYAAFQGSVRALGEAAKIAAKTKELSDLKAKEKADEAYKRLLADNSSLGKRLRDSRAGSGFLPKPPDNSPSPARTCFDSAKLESTLQRLDAGVSGLIAEGDHFQLRLSTAAEWAKSITRQ